MYISSAQMYAQLQGVEKTVDRMDAKLDAVLTARVEQQRTEDDHEKRIRALEERRWPHPSLTVGSGVVAAAAAVAALWPHFH